MQSEAGVRDGVGVGNEAVVEDGAYLDGLRAYQQRRRSDTLAAVREAIERLKADGKEINFNAVAHESHITRKTLYAVDEVRSMITHERGEAVAVAVEKVVAVAGVAPPAPPANDPNGENEMQRARIVKLENELNALRSSLRAIRAELLRDF
ncbi:hypothetical protein FACS1894103_3900 [Campylobacterota bacterium]|nr:hypothetical protein FACS1894103_3900 [Campylobacterota bacterium]